MIPITRKDHYLNEIVGWGDNAPEKPYIEEEFFFAEILGEAVQAPEPLPRYQMYLAKIAGREIEIPYPEVRLEYFLAKAAGMDIETPTPITREEIYWSNYTAIVEFEFEGVPPLTYKAIEGTLENYRIYGNTVDGESVGDRTGNLFDGVVKQGTRDVNNGTNNPNAANRVITSNVNVTADSIYTLSAISTKTTLVTIGYYDSDNRPAGTIGEYWQSAPCTFTIPENGTVYFIIKNSDGSNIVPADISNIMLNSGSTALPYEPYGYKVPITVTNSGTTSNETIYLPEQIRKVGDEAEYIDYGEQKQYRVRKNLLPNTVISQTVRGITFTVNEDKSITCNGTATGTIDMHLLDPVFLLPAGNYRLSGTPSGGGTSSYYLRAWYSFSGNVIWLDDSGIGRNFTLLDTTQMRSSIVIFSGQVLDHVTFYPMIRKAAIEDDTYEPYIENTDLDVTLPALPTLAGTNVLSVGTAVQPSDVYIKGRIKKGE